jgi:hypothetical protein
MSMATDLSDALAEALAEYSFAETTPTVERKNWPSYDIEDMEDARVAVMPATIETLRVNRTEWQYDYGVVVFVGRHAPTEELADETFALAEEIVDAIRQHDWDEAVQFPEGVTSPMTVEFEINPDEALQDRNVWRGLITATYRIHRP